MKALTIEALKWLGVALFVGAAVYSRTAHAQVATDAVSLTWVNATQLTTGAPIPAAPDPLSLKTTRIQRSIATACDGGTFGTVEQTLNVTPDVLSVLFENLRPAGKHCFRVAHIQVNDGQSAWSAVGTKTIVIPAPPKTRPPTITIQ